MSPSEYQELAEFLRQHSAQVGHRFASLEQQIGDLRASMEERFREVLGHFDEIYRRLERLEQEYWAIIQGLRRIEAVLADEQGRRRIVERDLAELREKLALLQARIDDIEQRLRP